MDLYLAGADQPVSRKILKQLGVHRASLSFYEWRNRYGDNNLERLNLVCTLAVTSGATRKENLDWELFAEDYAEFCEANADRFSLVYDLDAAACPATVRRSLRARLDGLDNFVAFPMADETLQDLSRRYEYLGVNAKVAKSTPPRELRRLPNKLCGSNVTDQTVLSEARFYATTTHAWLSARRYGELWVFAGGKLHHYTAQQRSRAARQHRAALEALGVDPEAAGGESPAALILSAVRSLEALADHLTARPRDRSSSDALPESPTDDLSQSLVPVPDAPGVLDRFRVPEQLPSITFDNTENSQVARPIDGTMRKCDSCFLAEHCPKYEAHSTCAYKIPVKIRTEAEWRAACSALLEMQWQRVNFAVFAEQVEGTGLQQKVGAEMDRFFRMSKEMGTATPPADPNNGVLSKIFSKPLAERTTQKFEETGHEMTGDDYDGSQAQDAEVVHQGPTGEPDPGPPGQGEEARDQDRAEGSDT